MEIKNNISVVVLTYNEERHIERCIASVKDVAHEIFLVDCYSSDGTCELARSLGAKVYYNKWVNHATQFNWALKNLPIETEWVFRLDADEVVTDSLKRDLNERIQQIPRSITGIYIKRKVYFMNRWIRFGTTYPLYVMRLFRFGKGHSEQRWMDEHIMISEGSAIRINGEIIDENKNNLGWWINKHNNYALREAIDILNIKFKLIEQDGIIPKFIGSQEQRKRWLKIRYSYMPLFLRPCMYFIYRYFLRLGFLDGVEGLIWHFLQGFWYRFIVDAKIYEIYSKGGVDNHSIRKVIEEEYGIKMN